MPERLLGPARWSLRTRLLLLLGAVALLLGATLTAQITLQANQRRLRNDLLRGFDPALVHVTDLSARITDQDTAVRSLAITGDERFLDDYASAVDATEESFEALRSVPGPAAGLDDDLAEVDDLVEAWRDAAALPVVEAPTAERAAVFTEELQEEGLQLMDRVRVSIDEIEAWLTSQRDDLVVELDAASQRTTWAMVVQVVGVVLSGLLLIVALSRVVVAPLDRLGRDARRVADGDLDHVVRGDGSPDLAHLGADVDAMRRRILTELEQLNAASADLERQALELARSNDDLEQFAYVASHDLQEPLRKVSSFCQLLQKRYGGQLDDRADEYIHYAVDGARRMQDLINDLLDFSRVGRTTESFVDVDLSAVVDDVTGTLAPAIEDTGATITVGDLPVVTGDPRLLTAAVQNLVGNALKFRGEDPPEVRIDATLSDSSPDGHEWVISVADNGIGVDPAYHDQIFVIFKRLHGKADYAGTGIGLALAKKIAEFHGGRIWLDPAPPPGATFKLALPAHDATERNPTDAG
jgi:signal transduction histidine kinase